MFAEKLWLGAIPEIYLKHGSHRLAENCSEFQISKSRDGKDNKHITRMVPSLNERQFDVNKQKVSLPHKVSNQQKLGSKPA